MHLDFNVLKLGCNTFQKPHITPLTLTHITPTHLFYRHVPCQHIYDISIYKPAIRCCGRKSVRPWYASRRVAFVFGSGSRLLCCCDECRWAQPLGLHLTAWPFGWGEINQTINRHHKPLPNLPAGRLHLPSLYHNTSRFVFVTRSCFTFSVSARDGCVLHQ